MRRPSRSAASSLLVLAAATGIALGPLGAAATAVAAVPLDVDDFSFASFDGTYTLSRASDGSSRLDTTETLVAEFPDTDQNHGIRRELVDDFDGHPTDIVVDAVTDGNGAPRAYESEEDDGFLVLTIAADDYVHGEQTYVIRYHQRYVDRYASDTDADEFYWDTNGTGWAQRFDRVSATVVLADGLSDALTGDATAVRGTEGEADPVAIDTVDGGFSVSADDLAAGENVSLAIGFAPGTFTARPSGFLDSPLPSLSLLGAVLALLGAVLAVRRRATVLRDAPGRPTIIVEYAPPAAGVALAAVLLHVGTKTLPAMVLDLAVAGHLRVVERPGRRARYALEFVSAEGASPERLAYLHVLFGDTLTPGEDRDLAKADAGVAKRTQKQNRAAVTAAATAGYTGRPGAGGAVLGLGLAVLGLVVAFFTGVAALDADYGGFWPLVTLFAAILCTVASAILIAHTPLTALGSETRDHLRGLREYIDLADEDRIRVLQSPEGAERIATDDAGAVLKLEERLLPYALLFGLERRWAAELAHFYESRDTAPSWYAGATAFNAATFASSVGSMATSASSFSATSGGSGGGAVSGGGGGGGGGGGV